MARANFFKRNFPFALGSGPFVWQILFFYVPLILLLVSSVVKLSSDSHLSTLTFDHFRPLFRGTYFRIMINSLIMALSTSVLCLFIAYPVAYFMAFRAKRFKNLLLFLLIVPFWTNFLLHVYAWFFVLEKEGFLNNFLIKFHLISEPLHFLNSLFAVMLMMIYYYLPFMTLPIYSSLERFDHRLMEASFDLGASWWETFRGIMLPLSLPSMRAGFFLVFIPSFGEFVIPELMGGDRHYFVGNVVSQFILGDRTGGMGAAFTVISSLILIGASLSIFYLFKRLSNFLIKRT
ncbi:MAG: ABC transporter permease [Simkaniaceae bacterium]